MQFTQAQRRRAKLKLAVTGPPGSGKTMSALRLATGLVGPGGRIALIDTENCSASLYADRFKFDTLDIAPPYESEKFIEAIDAAVAAGYDCLIIDSASHFWKGVLEFKGALDSRGGNSFTNWNQAGKKYDAGLAGILQSNIHLIACLRSKVEYVLEQDLKGKQVPRKVGLAPVFRDEGEYEFTTVFDIAHDHTAQVSKDRTGMYTDRIFQVTEEIGKQIGAWLDGAASLGEDLQRLSAQTERLLEKAVPEIRPAESTKTDYPDPRPASAPRPRAAPARASQAAPPRPRPGSVEDDELKDRAAFTDMIDQHREKAVRWMIREGWMRDGDGLEFVDITNIRKVLKRPAAFLRAVQQAAVAAGGAA